MNGIVKALTCVLGVLAVVACLATVGIIGYSFSDASGKKNTQTAQKQDEPQQVVVDVAAQTQQQIQEAPVPTKEPEGIDETEGAEDSEKTTPEPTKTVVNPENHVHDYVESVEKKATCYSAGKVKYACECGDTYYVDVMSTGHVGDDWEVIQKPTEDEDGVQVKKCIYCDEIVAQETVPFEDKDEDDEEEDQEHVHQYAAETVREPSCVLAGLRRYNCNCGSFYTEMIPASGHVASDWTIAAGATSTHMGTEQRTCSVCSVVLDSRPTDKTLPEASASASASASAGAQATATAQATASATAANGSASPSASANASASASAGASASPGHAHSYSSYVLKEANCTEKGIRSFVCTCGSSYAESISLDMNNHTYRAIVIPATKTTQGYTVYTCVRCNYSYYDNFTPALSPNANTGS